MILENEQQFVPLEEIDEEPVEDKDASHWIEFEQVNTKPHYIYRIFLNVSAPS